MESSTWVTELDRQSAAGAAVGIRTRLLRAEADKLALAAHWADLHPEESVEGSGRVFRGTERAVLVGGDGTPAVGEFAAAELGALLQVSMAAASILMADALDLRHRLPMLWRGVDEGSVEAWKARKVARRTRAVGLTHVQSLWVDMHTTPYIASQPWSAFLDRLEGAIVEVDPQAAEDRRRAAAMERFVTTGQSNEYGLKTIVAKAAAGDAIFFVAMCDRLAQIMLLEGDTDPVDVRRSKAIGLLADPARALELLMRHACAVPEDQPDEPPESDSTPEEPPVTGGEDRPGETGGNEPATARSADPMPFVRPTEADLSKLRPSTVLYLHMSRESWDAARAGRNVGVVRLEGVGAITVPQATELLGHGNVTIRPVVDLAEDRPVDGYEVPERMREILFLRNPACVFPWSANRSRRKDGDHSKPYAPPREGGPPGQTRVDNLGLLGRRAHRVKTHAPGWRHHQPEPGVHYWRTPAGYWFRVDHRGTHALGRHGSLPWTPPAEHPHHDEADLCWPLLDRSPLERVFAESCGWDGPDR